MFKLLVQLVLMFQYISLGLSRCSYPPAINNTESEIHASHSFAEGSIINYSCLSGYEPFGTGIFICMNGHWIGSFNCTIRKCPSVKPPDHGMMYNSCREVACVVNFFCNEGYLRLGSISSYCQVNGNWSHAVPECQIKKCLSPPVLEHGYLNWTGDRSHVYGTELSVKCQKGFIRSGPSRIYCASNRQWTKAPACLPSKCSSYPGLDGKCVEKTKVQSLRDDRLLLLMYCTENAVYIHINDRGAVCSNGSWDNLSMSCYCDCKVNIDSEGVLFENFNPTILLKHGETLSWSCKDGYTNATSDPLTCDNGVIETPKCVPNTENESKKSSGSEKLGTTPTDLLVTCCIAGILLYYNPYHLHKETPQ